jgi:hypothetical protein
MGLLVRRRFARGADGVGHRDSPVAAHLAPSPDPEERRQQERQLESGRAQAHCAPLRRTSAGRAGAGVASGTRWRAARLRTGRSTSSTSCPIGRLASTTTTSASAVAGLLPAPRPKRAPSSTPPAFHLCAAVQDHDEASASIPPAGQAADRKHGAQRRRRTAGKPTQQPSRGREAVARVGTGAVAKMERRHRKAVHQLARHARPDRLGTEQGHGKHRRAPGVDRSTPACDSKQRK